MNESFLKPLLSEVIKGYSLLPPIQGVFLYFKHPNIHEYAEIDKKYNFFFEQAQKDSIPTEKQQLERLTQEGLWSDKKDKELKDSEYFLQGLYQSKNKLFKKFDVEQLEAETKKTEEKIKQIKEEKIKLIGRTAEQLANQSSSSFYIQNLIFIDRELKNSLPDYENLDEEELNSITEKLNAKLGELNSNILKKIAITPFFLNVFSLCDNNPFHYYGKPVCELTFYQSELFVYGCQFKHIFSEDRDKFSPELLDNPDELLNSYEKTKNLQEMFDKIGKDGGAMGVSSKEQMENLKKQGYKEFDLSNSLKKHGGKMNMQQMMEEHERLGG